MKNLHSLFLSFLAIISLSLLLLGTNPQSAEAVDVGLFVAEVSFDGRIEDVQSKLLATGLFSSVDIRLLQSPNVTPTLAELQNYDVIFTWSDFNYADNVAWGNVLADYMDTGCGVVYALYATSLPSGLELAGRIVSDGYLPLLNIGGGIPNAVHSLVPNIPTHPLLNGVSSFNGGSVSFHHPMSVVPGATQVAKWTDGFPLIATWSPPGSSGTIVGLNMYPPSSDNNPIWWDSSTDGAQIMANALSFAVCNNNDNDNDGVNDVDDLCDESNTDPTVIIDGCDSGIANSLGVDGCSVSDLIAEIASEASNHGNFVSDVSHLLNDLKKAGLISGSDKGAIQSCASEADIP